MNPILAEIYSTIIPSAPFIIAAYALVLVAFLVWLGMVFTKQSKLAAKLDVLEGMLEDQKKSE